jgi:DNA-binding NtrC family response regulator
MAAIRVLLVDDEEQFLATTKVLLEKRGIETHTAASGAEALRILEERPIDVVILDVKMPGMDGVEVLRLIKQYGYLVEVIMLTGHAAVDSAVEGLKLGAFDYVMKPCDIPDLLAKIREAFDSKAAKERRRSKASREEGPD